MSEPTPNKESVNLPLHRFRDSQGNCTCASNFATGTFCPFLMTSSFGTREHCFWTEGRGRLRPMLERRDDGRGTLIPQPECPLWFPLEQS
jgi:hypothetical protein